MFKNWNAKKLVLMNTLKLVCIYMDGALGGGGLNFEK